MTDFKDEILIHLIQIIVLIAFAFILKDILAALIVSFLSRPLSKMAIRFLKREQNKNNR